ISSRKPPGLRVSLRTRNRRAHLLHTFQIAHETHQMTRKEEMDLVYKEESYAIIGARFAVYKDKGCGFHEPVYHECLEIEFEFQTLPFLSKPPRTLQYRGRT